MRADTIKIGLRPIIGADARVLILGTLPGDESIRRQEYYGHPRNHFWPIIAMLSGKDPPEPYADRVAMLCQCRLALWDVLASAERAGSLDSAIRHGAANAISELLAQHPGIHTIAFNGQGAAKLFKRRVVKPGCIEAEKFALISLPSTSPAYTKSLSDKSAEWRAHLGTALAP
ncbi:MAG: DNA-deoxyinosine glycosylase [Hyphomicrobium sp.]